MNQNKLIFLLFLIFSKLIGQSISQKELEKPNPESQIVFIFKKQKSEKVSNIGVNILGSPIYYSEKNNFTTVELNPNNNISNDTIIKTITSDKICLSHTFNKTQKFVYEFQKGDTIVFDYEKGYPYATIINRKTLKFDNNFLADLKIEKPIEDFQFTFANKRIRSYNENKIYLKELNEYRINVDKLLDSFLEQKLISQSNYELYKAANRFYEININKSLMSFITNTDLKRDDLLYLRTYRYFLNNYVIEKFKLKTEFSDPMSCNSKVAFDSVVKSNIFSKRIKEYLLNAHMINIADKNSVADLNEYFKKFKASVSDLTMIEKIKNNYLLDFTSLKNETKVVNLSNSNKDRITLENLIAKNKGKVIFIDFWASWCAPCRAAMPSSRKLKFDYKEKEIVFFYVSLDSDFEKWVSASEKEKLFESENNFLALNYPNAVLFKGMKLESIPRYLIYSKKGILVHQNAPSPETEEIRKELDKYLIEQ